MNAGFIGPDSPKWRELLPRIPHDVYHLPGYVECAARHEQGRAIAFYAEEDDWAFLAPLLIRNLPAGLGAPSDWCDVTTPYGYPAPVMTDANELELVDNALKLFRQLGGERGIATAFFRLHPLLPIPFSALSKHGALVHHGQTVYNDLTASTEQIWAETRENHKRGIRKLRLSGFESKLDDWQHFDDFISIYKSTMKRVSAGSFYFFSDDYFKDLRATIGNCLHLCTVVSPKGIVASAGLFTVVNRIAQYHLGATSDDYLSEATSKLMFDFVRRWAKSEGCRILHLGGGVGGGADSLFSFKAGFSKLKADFYTYRMILDEKKYAALVCLWEQSGNKERDSSKFFPAYRAPVT